MWGETITEKGDGMWLCRHIMSSVSHAQCACLQLLRAPMKRTLEDVADVICHRIMPQAPDTLYNTHLFRPTISNIASVASR